MKVLVTGSASLPGVEVMRRLKARGIPCVGVDKPDFLLTDAPSVYRTVESCMPDTIVHCAGYFNADKAESLPEKCAALNGLGTLTVARAAVRVNAKLLYLSSPQVFSGAGEEPFAAADPTAPKNVFGMSKVQGEDAVRSLLTKYIIVRADWIFGEGKGDFLRPLIQAAQDRQVLRVARDQFGSPTYARDLAETICDLIEGSRFGIWHVRNEGFFSRAEFAEMVMKKAGIDCRILPVATADLPGSPRRPLNLRMTAELPAGFAPMPPVEDALDRFLENAQR